MKPGAFTFTEKWRAKVNSLGETGMGYVVATVTLKDGRQFKQAIIDSGILSRIRGLPDIPFTEDDVLDLTATHEKWNWKETP